MNVIDKMQLSNWQEGNHNSLRVCLGIRRGKESKASLNISRLRYIEFKRLNFY